MKITRHELYELVWKKPMTKLSKEFGLSDVGLAKICRKHGIPIPERGYWAKVDAGRKAPFKALPRKDYNPEFLIQEKPPISEAVTQAKLALKEIQTTTINKLGEINVPTQLDSPHPLTKKTQKFYENIAKKIEHAAKVKHRSRLDWDDRPPLDDYGRYQCWPKEGYHLKVSMSEVDRALCFLDTLIKKLEEQGFVIENNSAHKQYGREQLIEAVKLGERSSFKLAEGYKQTYLTGEELSQAKKEFKWATGIQRKPSGTLTFTITGTESWNEKKYADTKSKKLEDYLLRIVADFIHRIDEEKQAKAKKIQDEIARIERERLRAIEQARNAARQRQFTEAMEESELIKQFDQFEHYINKLELAYIEHHGQVDTNVQAWFDLVRSTAQTKNPFTKRLEYLNRIRNLNLENIDWQ